MGRQTSRTRMKGKATEVLMSALLLSAASGVSIAPSYRVAVAQQAEASFSIPAGPLNRALAAFGAQAGVQVTYLAASAAGKSAPGFTGRATPEQVLAKILEGSGLSYSFPDRGTVAISVPDARSGGGVSADGSTVLETITVEGESATGPVDGLVAHRSSSSTKTDTPLIQTPQSVSVVTADQIKNQGSQTIGQALQYTPGTRGEAYGTNTTRDHVRVRGFSPNFYQDGLILPYGIGSQGIQSEPYGIERLEVLRGPSSVLYGQNPPGGIVNMVSKRPQAEARNEVFVQGGTFDRLQGGFDFTGPVNDDGSLLYRLVGVGRKSGTQVDFVDDNRFYVAPSVTWNPTDQTSLTVLGYVQRDDAGISGQYFPAVGTIRPYPNGSYIPTSRYIGEPAVDRFDRRIWSIGYDFSHEFNEALTFRQAVRYTNSNVYNHAVFTTGVLANNRTITRRLSSIDRTLDYFNIDNQLLGTLDTGPLEHQWIIGFDHRNNSETATNGRATATNLDVMNPVYAGGVGPYVLTQNYKDYVRQLGIYAQDQIRYADWLLTLSGRYDWSRSGRDNYFPVLAPTRTDEAAFTGRVGLTYLFDNGIAPYVSYSTSFEPVIGATAPARGAVPFQPTEGKQIEFGVKYEPTWFDGLFTAAVYDLRQTNVSTTDPANVGYSVQTGEVRARGAEFEARANITAAFSLLGSYSYTETDVTKSNVAAQLGKDLPSTPRHQASLWAEYAFQEGEALNGLTLGGGVRYVGANFGDTLNVWRASPSTLFDASLTLDLGTLTPEAKGATLAINATNLFDRKTVDVCFNEYSCMYGQRRTVSATLKYQW